MLHIDSGNRNNTSIVDKPPLLDLPPHTGSSIVIFGASKAGKTTLMTYLYDEFFSDYICVLCADNPQIDSYKIFRKGGCVIVQDFNIFIRLVELAKDINEQTLNNYKFCFFLDDMVMQKDSDIIKKLVLTYRNSNLSSVICLQATTLFSKQNRGSVNHCFFCRYNGYEGRKDAVERFLRGDLCDNGKIRRIEDLTQVYQDLTKDYHIIQKNMLDDNGISIHKLSKYDVPWILGKKK